MLLVPKKTKYRRTFKGQRPGMAQRGNELVFGEFGLKAVGRDFLTSRQLEAARRAIVHELNRNGRIWIRVYPDKPITKKPNEVRMGSGKGAVDHYAVVIRPGRILFELGGVSQELAHKAMSLAAYKLPFKTKIIDKKDYL